MGGQLSCVSSKAADDSPKKGKSPKEPKPAAGLPLPPSKPRVVKTTETSISISWDKPTYDGGNAIFGYAVKMGREGQNSWRKLTAEAETCSWDATELEPNTSYKFFVQAENDNGLSKPSEISDPISTLSLKSVSATAPDDEAESILAKGDENENEADKNGDAAKIEFGASAQKYIVKDDDEKKSRKSSSSSSEGEEDLSVDVDHKKDSADEAKEDTPGMTHTITTGTTETILTGKTEAGKVKTVTETEEKKIESSGATIELPTLAAGATISPPIVKTESKESVKSSSSSSSSDDEKQKSDADAKNDIAKAASAGVTTEVDFSANGTSVGHGTGVLSSFLDSRLYQYSNDSLLDEENEEDADVKNKNRVNKNMDIQKHDKRYFIEIETVGADEKLDQNCEDNDHYIHTQVPPIEPMEFECDQSNRLSIISERSAEDNLSPCSPDTKMREGQHFIFAKKDITYNSSSKTETTVSKIPMPGSKIPSRRQDPVVLDTVSAEKPQLESKIPPPQIKSPSTGKTTPESRKPSLGSSFGMKVASEEKESPREETERRSSIPTLSNKTEAKITPPTSIPRRGSAPKTSIPLKKDNSGDKINVTLAGNISTSDENVNETKIPTGIPRRKSIEKPDSSSKITPPSTRIATGVPRGASGIRPPGSFGFQTRVESSS